MNEFVLHGTLIEAAWAATIAAGRHKERGLGIGPKGVHGDPCLEVRDRADQAEPAHARLSVHDDNCSVPVELNVPYVEGKKFIDPSSRSHMSMKRGRSRGFSQASIIFEMSSRVMS